MIRECIEEVGLEPVDYEYVARLSFSQPSENRLSISHIYICKTWKGTLIELDRNRRNETSLV